MPESILKSFLAAECARSTPRDRRNVRRLMWIAAAWAVSAVGCEYLLDEQLLPAGPVAWGAAAIPSVLAVFALLAYTRFLRESDELARMIQLHALALGFGGGWFFVMGYKFFEILGAPRADEGDVMVAMACLYSLGIVLGLRRYR